MMEAGGLLTAAEAERRVLVLENPAFPGQSRATATLYAGIQLVLPGEVARAHRHSQSALRFVLESDGGYTAVGGERIRMAFGDFVITPSWAFHDHGNDTQAPTLWLDVLDVPLVSFFEASFAEPHNAARQEALRPEGDSLARFGSGLLPLETVSPYGKTSPVFSYPYDRTRNALAALEAAGAPDPRWGHVLRYANPLDGGWAMPTIASWIALLPVGFETVPVRSTDGLIVAVAEGHGTAQIGETVLDFGPKDVFVLPNWQARRFRATEDCVLFVCSDRAAQEKLGLWRETPAA
jgi:gentisate 1,2-dioxygenase